MANQLEMVPAHMRDLVGEAGVYRRWVSQLNCFCVAAIFHAPELLGQMGGDLDENSRIAEEFLFHSGRFAPGKKREVGTINVYFAASSTSPWWERPTGILHVSTNLGNWKVLTKDGFGSSWCEIIPYDQEERLQKRKGGGIATALMALK
jgi:hypothetical protein